MLLSALLFATLTASTAAAEVQENPRVLYLYGYIDEAGRRPGDAGYNGRPFHPMRLDNVSPGMPGDRDEARGMSEFRTALQEAGFTVDQRLDSEFTFSAASLAPYKVVILGSNNRRFNRSTNGVTEAQAVRTWVEAGGGLIAWSDSAFGGDWQIVGVGNSTGAVSNNDLTAQFGMTFLRDNGVDHSGPAEKTPGHGIHTWEEPHFLNMFRTDGFLPEGIVIYGEGVSYVRIDPARGAKMLARPQNGALRVDAADGQYLPERDAAVAVNEVGRGRVVGFFDRNTFWNGGEGTNIFEVDNRLFAQFMVMWAAGSEY